MKENVPASLRRWFVIHFVVDVLFALPLLLFPREIVTLFGFEATNLLFARIVGAALLGIGCASFLARQESKDTFIGMLNLKIIWSVGAIFGLSLSIIEGAPHSSWFFLMIFVVFAGIWTYYKRAIS